AQASRPFDRLIEKQKTQAKRTRPSSSPMTRASAAAVASTIDLTEAGSASDGGDTETLGDDVVVKSSPTKADTKLLARGPGSGEQSKSEADAEEPLRIPVTMSFPALTEGSLSAFPSASITH